MSKTGVSLGAAKFVISLMHSLFQWLAVILAISSFDLRAVNVVESWSAASTIASDLKTQGTVNAETLAVDIGSLRETHQVFTLRGTGSSLDIPLRVDPTGKALLLELQEIHLRRPAVFGYSVWVNGSMGVSEQRHHPL